MTEYADKDICERLYALSGWVPEAIYEGVWERGSNLVRGHKLFLDGGIPAYTLAFILDKLPKFYEENKIAYLLTIQPNPIGSGWQAHYRFASRTPNSSNTASRFRQEADNPASAAALLACTLFEQGVLERPAQNGESA